MVAALGVAALIVMLAAVFGLPLIGLILTLWDGWSKK